MPRSRPPMPWPSIRLTSLVRSRRDLDAIHYRLSRLIELGRLSEGEAVIITAASSSVGLAAIQIANSVGAISIATTCTGAKREALIKAGAKHVIATEEQDLAEEVMRLTGGKGARVAFDPVCGPGVEALAAALAEGGTIFLYGAWQPHRRRFRCSRRWRKT